MIIYAYIYVLPIYAYYRICIVYIAYHIIQLPSFAIYAVRPHVVEILAGRCDQVTENTYYFVYYCSC